MPRLQYSQKGRLYEDTMALLAEADIKVSSSKAHLVGAVFNFPDRVLYLRDDDDSAVRGGRVADGYRGRK